MRALCVCFIVDIPKKILYLARRYRDEVGTIARRGSVPARLGKGQGAK